MEGLDRERALLLVICLLDDGHRLGDAALYPLSHRKGGGTSWIRTVSSVLKRQLLGITRETLNVGNWGRKVSFEFCPT